MCVQYVIVVLRQGESQVDNQNKIELIVDNQDNAFIRWFKENTNFLTSKWQECTFDAIFRDINYLKEIMEDSLLGDVYQNWIEMAYAFADIRCNEILEKQREEAQNGSTREIGTAVV